MQMVLCLCVFFSLRGAHFVSGTDNAVAAATTTKMTTLYEIVIKIQISCVCMCSKVLRDFANIKFACIAISLFLSSNFIKYFNLIIAFTALRGKLPAGERGRERVERGE